MLTAEAARFTSPALHPGEVHLWAAWLDLDPVALVRLGQTLDARERERAGRLRLGRDRTRWVASRGWLRLLLASYLGVAPTEVRLGTTDLGKPRLMDGPEWLQFNLSHSAQAAAYVVAHGRNVGIDLEVVTDEPTANHVPAWVFAASEQRFLAGSTDDARDRRALGLWTGKEAWLKASGRGLGGSPREVVLAGGPDGEISLRRLPPGRDPKDWCLREFDAFPGYVGAVAAHGTGASLPRAAWRLEAAAAALRGGTAARSPSATPARREAGAR